MILFFFFFWIGLGQERVFGIPLFFGKLCVTNWLAYFCKRVSGPWYIFGAYLGQWSLVGQ
jgi:hypothetical protein